MDTSTAFQLDARTKQNKTTFQSIPGHLQKKIIYSDYLKFKE